MLKKRLFMTNLLSKKNLFLFLSSIGLSVISLKNCFSSFLIYKTRSLYALMIISSLFLMSTQNFSYAYSNEPIMIVRYKNKNISYENSLRLLIKKATQANPKAIYEVVGILTNDGNIDFINEEILKFVNRIKENGISSEKISTRVETDNFIKVEEIRLIMKTHNN